MMRNTNSTITFYTSDDGQLQLDVRLEEDTVWLNQKQMAELFGVDVRTISEHLQNIFVSEELTEHSVIRKIRTTANDGKKYNTQFYNLDAIISVGYRVKSKTATQFRIWATNILRGYITDGYVLHTERLQQQGADIATLMKLLEDVSDKYTLAGPEAQHMMRIIRAYAQSFTLLQQYDEDALSTPNGTEIVAEFSAQDAKKILASLKAELIVKKEATDLFAQERGDGFISLIGNIAQTFDGKALYPSAESRAAHLLYFMVKDHPFVDGNKRSAACLFVYYLSMQGVAQSRLSNTGLVALTLLVAESDPSQKAIIIRLIENLIA